MATSAINHEYIAVHHGFNLRRTRSGLASYPMLSILLGSYEVKAGAV